MEDFKAGSLLAVVILALTIAAYLTTYNADYVPVTDIKAEQAVILPSEELTVVHVYEDGCIEVMEPVDGEVKFYCETEFE